MSTLMISISGIRGIVGETLNPETALHMAAAFATVSPDGEILVASDGRTSGDSLRAACCAGLTAMGRTAVDLGVTTTPTTEIAVVAREAAGAIIVTASHNPAEWNGLKFLGPDGTFIRQEQVDRLIDTWRRGEFAWHRWENVAPVIRWDGASSEHTERILELDVIDVDACRAAAFPVVLDTINASGGTIAPALLEKLGCRVTHVNGAIHGRFDRMPEPLPENIASVGAAVRESGAVVGLVLDPDSDRLALLDENGIAIGEEYTLALAVAAIRDKKPGAPVVVNVSTSRMIDDVAQRHGFTVYRTPVGEINVVDGMLALGAELGGEGNGGVIYGPLHYGRDGLLGIALIIDILARERVPLSELITRIPRYTIVKRKASVDPEIRGRVLESLRNAAPIRNAELDTCDGVKLIWPDRWLHVRPSNTEPVVRIIAEAPTDRDANDLCDFATSLIDAR